MVTHLTPHRKSRKFICVIHIECEDATTREVELIREKLYMVKYLKMGQIVEKIGRLTIVDLSDYPQIVLDSSNKYNSYIEAIKLDDIIDMIGLDEV